jgi:signal transduction histidine kinase
MLDEGGMRQAIAGLLENAVKFTPAGSIVVTLTAEARSGLPVTIEIADTGVGIHPENRTRILAPFEQADASSTRVADGAGLGLTVAAALLEASGCKLDFMSVPGEGSVFSIRLPGGGPELATTPA